MLIGGALLVLAVLGALEAVRGIGRRAGVEEAPLPAGSEIAARAEGSDYADAYRVAIPLAEIPLDGVAGPSAKDAVVFRGEHEVIYQGRAPGLSYLLSYHVRPGAGSSVLTMTTAVFYESFLGPLYFTPVKVGHRGLLPYAVARVARELTEEAEARDSEG